MNTPVTLRIDQPLFSRMRDHLFPGDGDEHGAAIVAGIAETARGTRLLARELIVARDGIDFVPGRRGYRAFSSRFVAQVSDRCAQQGLCYLNVHNHGGKDAVEFSADDLNSHERGYRALLDITGGGPVGALVMARNAMAGDIWTPGRRYELDHAVIIGAHVRRLFPKLANGPIAVDSMYDRHARIFGDVGQMILSDLKVGIIGLGGGGSLLNEWLSKLGVGHIVAIDPDYFDRTNHPRMVGTRLWEAFGWLVQSPNPVLRRIGLRVARRKVHIARRVAKQANPLIRYDAVVGDVMDEPTARLLRDADFIFLASDTIRSRVVFNALVHQYLIPGAQVGARVQTNKATGKIEQIHTAGRMVMPYADGGCMQCHNLIPASRLTDELLSAQERRRQRYVEDESVIQPAVVTLNVLSAAQVANDLMMIFTGLYDEDLKLPHIMHFVRERQLERVTPTSNADCPDCSLHPRSSRARGDRARLPCRA